MSGIHRTDNDLLDYYWSWIIDANIYEANGVCPAIELPVGEHQIEPVGHLEDAAFDSYASHAIVSTTRTFGA